VDPDELTHIMVNAPHTFISIPFHLHTLSFPHLLVSTKYTGPVLDIIAPSASYTTSILW
jgi:hypothetical protein